MHTQVRNTLKAPTEEDWGDWRSDVDIGAAYKVFFGKTAKEVQEDFYRCVIERADELRFVPRAVFKYYIFAYCDFIMAGNFQLYDEADAANCFLELIIHKLKNNREDVIELMPSLMPTIKHIAKNQDTINAWQIQTYPRE